MALPAAGLVASNSLESAFQEPPKAKEPPKVVYRTLGKTDLKPSGVGYGIGYVPPTDVVARALDMGINYFDTARDYKDSERIFSGVIKGRQRDKIIIATKSPSYRKEQILKDLDTSLSELGTDYLDIWHLHARDTPASIPDGALEAMQIAKKSGKARYLGFSCHKPYAMVDFIIKTKVFDVMQMTYSYPIGGRLRNDAVDKLRAAGIGVIAMKVVVAVSGLNIADFSGKPKSTGQGPLAGIKWVLTNPGIGTTVPHMKTIPELEMNFRAMSEPYTAGRRAIAVYAERTDPAELLSHVLRMRRKMPKGHAGSGCIALPGVSRLLRQLPSSGDELQWPGERDPRCALQRLFSLRRPMPEWRSCPGSLDPRADPFSLTVFLIGLCGKAGGSR